MSGAGFIRINGITRANRHAVTDAAKEAIYHARGWIEDFQQFSNLSITIIFQMPTGGRERLRQELEGAGLSLDKHDLEALTAPRREKELIGTLQITFLHGEPDLRREVPPIPG